MLSVCIFARARSNVCQVPNFAFFLSHLRRTNLDRMQTIARDYLDRPVHTDIDKFALFDLSFNEIRKYVNEGDTETK